MVSIKVMESIEILICQEKIEMLENLKLFLKDKIDEDFNQISNLIDEFSKNEIDNKDNIDIVNKNMNNIDDKVKKEKVKKEKVKKEKVKKEKVKSNRKKTYYNDWLGKALSELAKQQDSLPEEERIPKKERMSFVGAKWKEYKKTENFEEEQKNWKLKQEDIIKLSNKIPETTDSDDSNSINNEKSNKLDDNKKNNELSSDDEIVENRKYKRYNDNDDESTSDYEELTTLNSSSNDEEDISN